MSQNYYIEEHIKKYGRRFDYETKKAKALVRSEKKKVTLAKELTGIKAKLFAKKQKTIKAQKKKEIRMQNVKEKIIEKIQSGPLPLFLMDRGIITKGKELAHSIKEKRREASAKYSVPIPRIGGISDKEMFNVVITGKKRGKQWKRMVTKPCFVGENFTRKIPKQERFIRPMALRFKNAHVSHPDMKVTFNLPIISIKTNPHSRLYSSLGVLTRGTIIEVNVSELGIVEQNGRVVWGKYAQITNNPERDGCVNAVLLT
ncbi:tgf beta-inducible nuclear protein 1 [Pseudoloma neurophilia]|uniref:Tgf beta-inducible nuclear protein 1 n=1 Tax=Pseudoloma neurophilia TaxID=146866 RepID=A0A0R0M1Q6_9MICR|nr:tgf beta-inducible nuclear protein 1 [Pseudoloma neurophilia]